MEQSNEIKTSLRREFSLYAAAIAFYEESLGELEHKYGFDTQAFLGKFESGHLEDKSDFFDWYAFAKLLEKWQKARDAIGSAIQ